MTLKISTLALALAAMAPLASPAEAAVGMPAASPAQPAETSRIVKIDFLGGPFFGKHGYYFPKSERRYFYSDYYPSANGGVRRHHRYGVCRRHPAACRH